VFATARCGAALVPTLIECRLRLDDGPGRFADVLQPSVPRHVTPKGFPMNRSMLMSAMLATPSLGACDRSTVADVPVPGAVPGPAGAKGATGKPGDGITVIVVARAASAPSD
jgi:hypothetical protein